MFNKSGGIVESLVRYEYQWSRYLAWSCPTNYYGLTLVSCKYIDKSLLPTTNKLDWLCYLSLSLSHSLSLTLSLSHTLSLSLSLSFSFSVLLSLFLSACLSLYLSSLAIPPFFCLCLCYISLSIYLHFFLCLSLHLALIQYSKSKCDPAFSYL